MAIFDVGTKTLFNQTSAPTGWTKETVNYNNHALRVVNGSVLGTGGSVDFTTGFTTTAYTYSSVALTYSVGAHTLTGPQLPFHDHPVGPTGSPGGRFTIAPTTIPANSTTPATVQPALLTFTTDNIGVPSGGSSAHTHPISITANGNVFSPNSTLAVNYIDVIIATLN